MCSISALERDGVPPGLENAVIDVKKGNKATKALVDFGVTNCFMRSATAKAMKLCFKGHPCKITMASQDLSVFVKGYVSTPLFIGDRKYDLKFEIMDQLRSPVILGEDFIKLHDRVSFAPGGPLPPLVIDIPGARSLSLK